MSASPDSPLGMLLDAGEGQEREGDVRGAIRVQYKTGQDNISGRTRTQKLYPTYLDHQGNPTVGHGVLVTNELKVLDRSGGQPWTRSGGAGGGVGVQGAQAAGWG